MGKIGAHVSAALSLDLAFDRAEEIGAECLQIFISPPRQWIKLEHTIEEIESFKTKSQITGIGPNYIHGTYLISLGTQNPEHLRKSIDWLVYAMNYAATLGIRGVVFHLGSHKGIGFENVLSQISEGLKSVFSKSESKGVLLIMENSAGAGSNIGGNLAQLGKILSRVGDKRLKICLDTQHAFASGYDLKTPEGLNDFLVELDEQIGFSNLALMHANDSKTEFNSGKDRHENIGEGFLGRAGFKNIINNKVFKDLPIILEVPGYSGNGPDVENINVMKNLRRKN